MNAPEAILAPTTTAGAPTPAAITPRSTTRAVKKTGPSRWTPRSVGQGAKPSRVKKPRL